MAKVGLTVLNSRRILFQYNFININKLFKTHSLGFLERRPSMG